MSHSRPGGLGKTHPADRTTIELAEFVKLHAESLLKLKFRNFRVLAYRSQVVAGTMYFIKVRIDAPSDQGCAHLKVFVQPWSHTKELVDAQAGHTLTDAIEYF